MGEQCGIVGLDKDGVAQADDGDRCAAVFGAGVEDDVAGSIHMDEVRDGTVAFGVVLEVAAERSPRAKIIPLKGAVGDDDVLRVFHKGVVNGDLLEAGIFLGENFVKLCWVGGNFEPALAGFVHLGLMLLQSFGDCDKRPDEHTGVPTVLAAVEVLEGAIEIRFFDELFGAIEGGFVRLHALRRRQRFANVNVAVAGSGLGGLDADGDNGLAAAGQIEGIGEDLLELFLLGDDVVGGKHGHHARGGTSANKRGAQGNGGAGVAAHRFSDNILLRQFGQLPANLGRLNFVGDDEDIFDGNQRQDAVNGLLKKRAVAEKSDELLGGLLAAHGPEALPFAAGHDDDETIVGVGFGFHDFFTA